MSRIIIGADRIGYDLKAQLTADLKTRDCDCEDLGPFEAVSVHYPVIARAVARRVAELPGSFGVLICSSGLGMTIAANKTMGVRAANCLSPAMALVARSHNDANVLCLGSSFIDAATAIRIIETFMTTAFEGGKHTARVRMLEGEGLGNLDRTDSCLEI